ncbi:MAG: ABC transporter permease [Coprobacillus cateniformis]|uniref:ABC transporter permease n=1 Tax=Longibaculum muris TaxID=1796628 RepID=UPI003AB3211B|nr:ABC transporter permease [Coprobacillus cateniformis]
MINMAKAEIKRLFKSKGFLISIFIFIFISLALMMLSSESEAAVKSMSENGFHLSVTIVPKTINSYALSFGISFGVLTMGIYLSHFICHEYNTNYIKNTVTQNNGRISVILSKTVIALIFSFITIILSYGVSLLYGTLLLDKFIIESIPEILKTIVLLFFISMAAFSLAIFVSTLSKNQAIGIIVLFLVASGMILPVIQNICQIMNISEVATYTLSYFFDILSVDIKNMYLKIISMCTIYILVYNILSVFILRKRDF